MRLDGSIPREEVDRAPSFPSSFPRATHRDLIARDQYWHSHPDRPIGEAIALAQEEGSGDRPVVLIPSQRDQRRYRLMVPELESGNQLVIVVAFLLAPNETAKEIASEITLRSVR